MSAWRCSRGIDRCGASATSTPKSERSGVSDAAMIPIGAAASDIWAGRRVVLVHDWLTGMRGGEKVLESLCRIFPEADLLTLFHVPGSVSNLIESRRVRPSF